MHFYTYDEWVNHSYYSIDDSEVSPGSSRVIDLSTLDTKYHYIVIRSCWKNPKFLSTYTKSSPAIVPTMEKIDCDIGCLYQLKGNTSSTRKKRGCIQEMTGSMGSTLVSPYIQVVQTLRYGEWIKQEYYDNFTNENKTGLEILIRDSSGPLYTRSDFPEKILIFQSIYSGAISFEEMDSSIEISFSSTNNNLSDKNYEYKLRTNQYSSDSLMLAALMLTFSSMSDNKVYLTIENLSNFVYGHVDMDREYDWNLLWENFNVESNTPLESSIMHHTKE